MVYVCTTTTNIYTSYVCITLIITSYVKYLLTSIYYLLLYMYTTPYPTLHPILSYYSEAIYAQYGGDKNLVLVEGDHNSARPRFLYDSIGIFLTQTLQVSRELIRGLSTRCSAGLLSVYVCLYYCIVCCVYTAASLEGRKYIDKR